MKQKVYRGIHNVPHDGMTPTANIDFTGLKEIQRRLVGETRAALGPMLARQPDRASPGMDRHVLPFRLT